MLSITASEIKQNSTLLQNALKDDMLVTKRDKPFVVVVDYDRYLALTNKQRESNNWIEKSFAVMSEADADILVEDIAQNRVNKEIDLWS